MTPQEQEMIDSLITRIRNTQVTDKDAAAEQHLQQGLAGYPDAVYVLAQTVLVQQYGLQQAQTQIQSLQSQLQDARQQPAQPASSGGSFLSHLFGGGSSSQQQQAPPQPPPYQPVSNPGPPPQYAAPAYAQPVYAQPAYAPAGGGGFLRGAMQTAAGVAAGEVAFAGMESLFHGFGGGGGYGGGFGGGYGGEGRPEEVINNYYGDDDRGDRREEGRDDANFQNSQPDSNLQDASYVTDSGTDNSDNGDMNLQDDNFNNDDSGSNDASFDNSGMDDSGGDDVSF